MILRNRLSLLLLVCAVYASTANGLGEDEKLTVRWDKVTRISQTTPTLQVVVNPPLRRGTPVHDNAFQALHDLQADYVRYVPWLPYPRLGVAELEPPKDGKTSWDFSVIDPMTIDFLESTKGHSVILNFSTIPQWMYKTDKPVTYPDDANQVMWDYEKGTELRDSSMKEVADYYGRLFAWYTKGNFTDEFGKRHESGYHYSIPYWEVLNEPEFEHQVTPETYTKIYDAVVESIRAVEPKTKFVGMALASPSENPRYFEYFLNPKNHKPGIPLDFISYHFYAIPTTDQTPDIQQYTFFTQADGFLNVVRYIEQVRKRFSPETRTTVDEIGSISADDIAQGTSGHITQPIPNSYWNLSGAVYAHIFAELTRLGVDVAGESQLVGAPTQFPSVSMVDWTKGKPNARYWVLKLLKDSFGPGDKLVEIEPFSPFAASSAYFSSLAVVTPNGKRRLLLVNKRDREFQLSIPGASGGQLSVVDQSTAFDPPTSSKLQSEKVKVKGLGVAVVTLP
jgi:hypothetical protein